MGARPNAVFSVSPIAGCRLVQRNGCDFISQRERAFTGTCRVVSSGDDFFGSGEPYVGAVLTNPTWARLLTEAGKMIEATGDRHHIYLEQFYVPKSQPEEGITQIELIMGS